MRAQSPPNEPSYAKPNKSRNAGQSQMSNAGGAPHTGELESMLGDIQSDLSKQGVNTKTKGLCGACNQPVIGQVCDSPMFRRNKNKNLFIKGDHLFKLTF